MSGREPPFRPYRLVPTPTQQPMILFKVDSGVSQAVNHVRQCGHLEQVHFPQRQRPVGEMDVGVAQTGQHQPSIQIEGPCAGSRDSVGTARSTNVRDAPPVPHQFGCPRHRWLVRENPGVGQDTVGRCCAFHTMYLLQSAAVWLIQGCRTNTQSWIIGGVGRKVVPSASATISTASSSSPDLGLR